MHLDSLSLPKLRMKCTTWSKKLDSCYKPHETHVQKKLPKSKIKRQLKLICAESGLYWESAQQQGATGCLQQQTDLQCELQKLVAQPKVNDFTACQECCSCRSASTAKNHCHTNL